MARSPAQGHRDHAESAPPALGEARPTAQRALHQHEPEREEQEHAGELGGGQAVEHPVPHAVDGLRQGAVAEGRDRSEVGERFHHGQRGPCHQGGARHGQGELTERAEASAAEAARRLQGRRALLGEGRPGQQVDVGIEHERHHRHHADIAAGIDAAGEAEPVSQKALDGTGEVEEAEKGESDDVGGNGEGQDESPLEERPAREPIVDDEPGEGGPDEEAPQPHSGHQEDRVDEQLDELGAEEVGPHLHGGRHHRGHDRRDRHSQDGGDAERGDGPGRPVPGARPARRDGEGAQAYLYPARSASLVAAA